MSETAPAVLLREYLEAIPDFERVKAKLHPDVSFRLHVPGGKTRQGRDRIVAGLKKEFNSFYSADKFKLTVLHTFGDGEFAAARFEIEAETALGPYRNDYCCMARFEDGLLIEGWEYLDSGSAALQLAGDAAASPG